MSVIEFIYNFDTVTWLGILIVYLFMSIVTGVICYKVNDCISLEDAYGPCAIAGLFFPITLTVIILYVFLMGICFGLGKIIYWIAE